MPYVAKIGMLPMGKVLVIDDEAFICDLLGEYFRDDLGMIVECATSSIEGADVLERGRYDLVLIDAGMSERSGFDLAALAANEDTPVLLISGHPETNLILHQFSFPHLTKPFTLDKLRIEAARIMNEHSKNIAGVKASAARMEANAQALKAAMAQSDRLLDAARRQEKLGRWGNVLTSETDSPSVG